MTNFLTQLIAVKIENDIKGKEGKDSFQDIFERYLN